MLIKFKPTTPGLRGTVLVSKKELSKEKPHKNLTKKFKSTGGRNNQGRITSRRMGGGVKRKYRIIDFKDLKLISMLKLSEPSTIQIDQHLFLLLNMMMEIINILFLLKILRLVKK